MNAKEREEYLEVNSKEFEGFMKGMKSIIVSDLGRGGEFVLDFAVVHRNIELLKKDRLEKDEFISLTGMINTPQGIDNFIEDYEHKMSSELKKYFDSLVRTGGEIVKSSVKPNFLSLVSFVSENLELHFVTKVSHADGTVEYRNYADFRDDDSNSKYPVKTYYIANGYPGKEVYLDV